MWKSHFQGKGSYEKFLLRIILQMSYCLSGKGCVSSCPLEMHTEMWGIGDTATRPSVASIGIEENNKNFSTFSSREFKFKAVRVLVTVQK